LACLGSPFDVGRDSHICFESGRFDHPALSKGDRGRATSKSVSPY
jgi:hypothetical protein